MADTTAPMDVAPPAPAPPADSEDHQEQPQPAPEQQAAAPQQEAAAQPPASDPAAAAAPVPPKEEAPAENGTSHEASAAPQAAAAAGTDVSATAAAAAAAAALGKHLNFRKLEPRALLRYLEHYGLTAKADATPEELAAMVGRHFDKEPVDEDEVLHSFFRSGMHANPLTRFDKKRKRGGGGSGGGAHYGGPVPVALPPMGGIQVVARPKPPAPHQVAKPDEEVAARPNTAENREDPTAGWILARVVKYVPERDQYQVRDEDDHNLLTLPSQSVIRLSDDASTLDVAKGDTVLAVFPDTTSFYRAQVNKIPKRGPGASVEVVCKFEDDEDETGRTPHRRVPARHVLKLSQVARYDAGGADGYSDAGGSGSRGESGGVRKGVKDYKAMISHALQKLPNSKGTLKEIFRIIEADFRDELQWKLEGDGKKTPMWKNQVRKLLVNPRSGFMFINAGERGAYYAEGAGGGGGGGGAGAGASGSFGSA